MNTRIATVALTAVALSAAAQFTLRDGRAPAPRRQLSADAPFRAPRTVWDSVYSAEQAKRGEEIFGKSCARCHQAALTGADDAPPLAGSAFLSGWDGLTVGTLSDRINSSMPSDDPGSLSRQQIVDVISYVLKYNTFPAGAAELPVQVELLKEIKIVATRPAGGQD